MNITTLLLLLIVGVFTVFAPFTVNAQGTLKSLEASFNKVTDIQGDAGVRDIGNLSQFIVQIVRIGLTIVAVIAVAAVIWGGFLYITSFGDENKAATAKRVILYAIIGLFIIGAAALIVNFFIGTFSTEGGGGSNTSGTGGADDPTSSNFAPGDSFGQ